MPSLLAPTTFSNAQRRAFELHRLAVKVFDPEHDRLVRRRAHFARRELAARIGQLDFGGLLRLRKRERQE